MPKVLVIDDSVSVRKVVERALAGRQIEVVCAASGSEALERIEQDPPDVIVCDVVMPDRDGYEICEFVKNHPRLGSTPVVLMSGIVNDEVRDRAAKARSEGVLSKPFAAEDLLKRLDGFLGAIPAKVPEAAAAPPQMPVPSLTVTPITPAVESRPTPLPRTIAAPAASAPASIGTPSKIASPPSIGTPPKPAMPSIGGPSKLVPPSMAAPPKPTLPSIGAQAKPVPPSIVTPPDLAPPSVAAPVDTAPATVSSSISAPDVAAPAMAPRPLVEPPVAAARPVVEPPAVAPARQESLPAGDSAAAILKQFTNMDGVQWAVLADREGFVVEATASAGVDADVAAALSACLAESSDGLGRELGRGTLHGIILEYEKGMVVVYGAGKAGLLAVGLAESAVLGKVRYFAKKALPELTRVL